MATLNGSLVALVTPMHEDGSLDLDAWRKLIDWHIKEGTDGLVVVGTTGESPTVDFDEHHVLIKSAVEHANRRIPVVAGTGANSTREAIELAAYAKQAGADMSLSVVPYYNKPTQEGLYQHFRAIAEAVDIPHIVYNVPGRTGINMTVETALRCAEIPNIVGDKEASPWRPLGAAVLAVAHLAGRVLLYLLRLALDMKATAKGLRQMVLDAAPLPSETRAPAKVPVVWQAPPDGSKKAALITLYQQDRRHGDRSQAARAASDLAPRAGLQAGTARTYINDYLASLSGQAS